MSRSWFLLLLLAVAGMAMDIDPLPTWHEGPSKQAIIAFVVKVTTPGTADFVPATERTAVFDNDGTLWPEKPLIEDLFIAAALPAAVQLDPTLAERPAIKAALADDTTYFHDHANAAVSEVMTAVYGNQTEEQFASAVKIWVEAARYPRPNRPIRGLAYQPMLDLLAYLRANDFQTWICTAGTTSFVRVMAQDVFGVPPTQIIGTTLKSEARPVDGVWSIYRLPAIELVNDQAVKPVNLARALGARPVFAAGTVGAGGDVAMLAYSKGRNGASFQMLINHNDERRETAYSERDGASLAAAAKLGFTVVDMARDWKQIYASPRRSVPMPPAAAH